jgi:arginine repressor
MITLDSKREAEERHRRNLFSKIIKQNEVTRKINLVQNLKEYK